MGLTKRFTGKKRKQMKNTTTIVWDCWLVYSLFSKIQNIKNKTIQRVKLFAIIKRNQCDIG